jgi:hypothetical protein
MRRVVGALRKALYGVVISEAPCCKGSTLRHPFFGATVYIMTQFYLFYNSGNKKKLVVGELVCSWFFVFFVYSLVSLVF